MNHTPGPWRWDNNRTSLMGRKGAVVLADGEGVWDLCSYAAIVQGNAKRADADARLIAAAPELLKALIDILPLADFGASEQSPPYADDHLLLAAQTAIAKATGGSHE